MRGQKYLRSMKMGLIGSESKETVDTKCIIIIQYTFWWKIRPSLGPSIAGTKCDRDKLIFSAARRCQSNCDENKIKIQSDRKSQNWDHHRRTSLPVWEYHPRDQKQMFPSDVMLKTCLATKWDREMLWKWKSLIENYAHKRLTSASITLNSTTIHSQ